MYSLFTAEIKIQSCVRRTEDLPETEKTKAKIKGNQMRKLLTAVAAAALMASAGAAMANGPAVMDHHAEGKMMKFSGAMMDKALAAQEDAVKARYQYRHPKETFEFFGITPGMTVAEVLPGGGGWYSKILMNYLGEKGTVVGVDYNISMWDVWVPGDSERAVKFREERKTWADKWAKDAQEWRSEGSAVMAAAALGALPEDMKGTVDVFFLPRAMHHLNRFEDKGDFLMPGLKDMYAALKPGGIVAIVQHRGSEERDDKASTGSAGYMKQSAVISKMKAAGFEFVAASEINANPKDHATDTDVVWRLPPTFGGAPEGEEEEAKAARIAKMTAIGETDRMTLKFRKPA